MLNQATASGNGGFKDNFEGHETKYVANYELLMCGWGALNDAKGKLDGSKRPRGSSSASEKFFEDRPKSSCRPSLT